MADNTLYMISGASSVTLGGVAIGGVGEGGIKLELKASYEKLGKNNAYAGVTDIMQHLEGGIVEFESEECDTVKIAQALGACAVDSGTPTISPNAVAINFGYNKLTAAALVIATVGPEYVAGDAQSTRTITLSRVVPTPETWELIMGIGKKQTTKYRFEILEAASGTDIALSDAWSQ